MGRGFEASDVVTRQIVDRGLVLFERRDVVFETSPCARRAGGLEAAQRKQRVAALEIAVDSFLQHGAEIVPNLGVGLRLLLRELVEIAEHAARHALPDRRQDGTFLDHLARDVERQIGRVHEPAHKAQIARQYLCFVRDEDALDIKLDAAVAIDVEQVERSRTGNKREGGILVPTLGTEMDRDVGLIELPGEAADRKSTRLNSSHLGISYAVFCLKKKKD